MATTNSATVRCRINPDVKDQAEEVLASIGMTTSDAIRLFLKQVAIRGTFPLEIKTPNQQSISAFEEKNLNSVTLEELRDM
ncbi:MAG: type II toxin-antitoxin system RelB/DinJ family antitoxin [Methylococcaceae bacterium]